MEETQYYVNGNIFEAHTPDGEVLRVDLNFDSVHTLRADAARTLIGRDGTLACTRSEFRAAYHRVMGAHLVTYLQPCTGTPTQHSYETAKGFATI